MTLIWALHELLDGREMGRISCMKYFHQTERDLWFILKITKMGVKNILVQLLALTCWKSFQNSNGLYKCEGENKNRSWPRWRKWRPDPYFLLYYLLGNGASHYSLSCASQKCPIILDSAFSFNWSWNPLISAF